MTCRTRPLSALALSGALLVWGASASAAPPPGGGTGPAAPAALCDGLIPTIVGTAADDTLTGTAGDDVIAGDLGADRIDGGGGDDVICGGEGADRLSGGPGDDRVYGETDGLVTQDEGTASVEALYGDLLDGGPGNDHLDAGDDPRQEREFLEGSPDTVAFGGPEAVRVELGGPGRWGVATGQGDDRVLGQHIVHVSGSAAADTIVGSDGDDSIDGNGGADLVRAGRGDDFLTSEDARYETGAATLMGGPGDDWIGVGGRAVGRGGAGRDQLELTSERGRAVVDGGRGADELSVRLTREASCLSVFGGPGRDSLALLSPTTGEAGGRDTPIRVGLANGPLSVGDGDACGRLDGDVEQIDLFGGHTTWYVTGSASDEQVRVDRSNKTVTRTRLVARMRGGDDVLVGHRNADLLDGGPGRDRAYGRGGRDRCLEVEVRRAC